MNLTLIYSYIFSAMKTDYNYPLSSVVGHENFFHKHERIFLKKLMSFNEAMELGTFISMSWDSYETTVFKVQS